MKRIYTQVVKKLGQFRVSNSIRCYRTNAVACNAKRLLKEALEIPVYNCFRWHKTLLNLKTFSLAMALKKLPLTHFYFDWFYTSDSITGTKLHWCFLACNNSVENASQKQDI